MQRYTVYFIWKLLCMFRVVPPSIIKSANNCIYSIWYLSHRYCYLPLSWKSWNWPSIIRSANNYLQHLVFVTPLLLPAAIVEELELVIHHQERKQLYLQHLVFVTPLLLPAAVVEELELQFQLFHDSGR
jgi:hypothetical protein